VRVAEHRHTGFCRSTHNWDIAIEENVSPEESVGQCDGICVNGSDDISSGSQVLSAGENGKDTGKQQQTHLAAFRDVNLCYVLPRQCRLVYKLLLMTAVRSSCCLVPRETRTVSYSLVTISAGGESLHERMDFPCEVDQIVHPDRSPTQKAVGSQYHQVTRNEGALVAGGSE